MSGFLARDKVLGVGVRRGGMGSHLFSSAPAWAPLGRAALARGGLRSRLPHSGSDARDAAAMAVRGLLRIIEGAPLSGGESP
jgi:hypothetical protein